MSISEETLWDYRGVAFPALCHPLARWESIPSGTFPWALQSRAAVLIIFSFGWQNTNQLSHASASCRHNAAERELGLSADTKKRLLVLMPHLPQRICLIRDSATICRVKIRTIVSPKQLSLRVSFHPQPTPILLKSLPNGCWGPQAEPCVPSSDIALATFFLCGDLGTGSTCQPGKDVLVPELRANAETQSPDTLCWHNQHSWHSSRFLRKLSAEVQAQQYERAL